ncbi:MAG: hypothetical protein AB7L84_07515 [Acidimicrobiia bacterium]
MLIEVGPVPSRSVRAWVGYARTVIEQRRAHDAETLPEEIRREFERYLDAWERAAGRDDPVRWSAEVDPAVVEYLVHGFYRVATRLAEESERPGARRAPVEGRAFYRALVDALLDALVAQGGSVAQFASELRPFWPWLTDDDPT